jgi:hypothetical protein
MYQLRLQLVGCGTGPVFSGNLAECDKRFDIRCYDVI